MNFEKLWRRVVRDEAEDLSSMRRCACVAPKIATMAQHGTWDYFSCVICAGLVPEQLIDRGLAFIREGSLH